MVRERFDARPASQDCISRFLSWIAYLIRDEDADEEEAPPSKEEALNPTHPVKRALMLMGAAFLMLYCWLRYRNDPLF